MTRLFEVSVWLDDVDNFNYQSFFIHAEGHNFAEINISVIFDKL